MDYTIYYKSCHESITDEEFPIYDLFFSGFDACDRTKEIYKNARANKKIWLIFPQYNKIKAEEYNGYEVYRNDFFEEDKYFEGFVEFYKINQFSKICIDITGILRPHLIYFIKLLYFIGIKKIDFLYSEPLKYQNSENTNFTGITGNVADIKWCSSEISNPSTKNDILIIASGYDDQLIQKVKQEYVRVKNKYFLVGFPSLQLDMYQESILKTNKIRENIDSEMSHHIEYAPAADPFVTAQAIHNIIDKNNDYTNIYLCPISTKPHTLGIALYYLFNFKTKPISIVFPYSKKYNSKTAIGQKRIWKYTFELP